MCSLLAFGTLSIIGNTGLQRCAASEYPRVVSDKTLENTWWDNLYYLRLKSQLDTIKGLLLLATQAAWSFCDSEKLSTSYRTRILNSTTIWTLQVPVLSPLELRVLVGVKYVTQFERHTSNKTFTSDEFGKLRKRLYMAAWTW